MQYPVIIHKDENSSYGVIIPDFKGCFTAGDTIEEALLNVQEAIECHIEGEDIELPLPSNLEDIATSEEAEGGFLAIAEVDLSFMDKQVERINITIPKYALLKIDKAWPKAKAKSRSAWLAELGLLKAKELGV